MILDVLYKKIKCNKCNNKAKVDDTCEIHEYSYKKDIIYCKCPNCDVPGSSQEISLNI